MVPTRERAPSSLFLLHEGTGILFDCGEGTQRQMNIAHINRNLVSIICVSHWHADHVAGLIGLLQTLNSKPEGHTVTIIGPVETQTRLNQLMKSTLYDDRLTLHFIECACQKPEMVYQTKDFELWAVALEHSTPVLGFSFREKDRRNIDVEKQKALGLPDSPLLHQLQNGLAVEFKGKKIKPEQVTYVKKGKIFSYITDTAFCPQAVDLAKESTLLVCESTYSRKHEDKAVEYKHMTSSQAAQIASMSQSEKLILTHFSQRYKDVQELVNEAREIFPETVAAYDFMTINL